MMKKLLKKVIFEIRSFQLADWLTFVAIVWLVGYCVWLKLKLHNVDFTAYSYLPFIIGKNFFKGKETQTKVGIAADPYGGVRKPLVNWLSGEIGKPAEGYTGELIAPLGEYERASLDFLKDYSGGGTSGLRQAGQKEISKTLSGDYDPTTSPYYQAVKAESANLLREHQSNIADISASKGRYHTGARVAEQSRAGTEITQALTTLLGSLAEKERERKLAAATTAQNMGIYEEQTPLRKTVALQEFGGLERIIEQARNEAMYREWLRVNQDYPLNIGQLAAGVQQAPLYAEKGYDPSGFAKMLGTFGKSFAGKAGENLGSKLFV